jgi:hypothetical protein
MTPATIERVRRRGQLSLDGIAVRAPRLAPEAAVLAPATAVARAAAAAAPAATAGTLDDVISGAWRELGAQRVAACPVCAEPMRPVHGARSGQCGGCGTTLA